MKAEFIGTREIEEGGGYAVRHFLFMQELDTRDMTFEIMATHLGDRTFNEGLILRSKVDVEITSLTCKIMFGSTTVTTRWTDKDEVRNEYVLELCLDLFKKISDGKPTFEVELLINEPEASPTDPSI